MVGQDFNAIAKERAQASAKNSAINVFRFDSDAPHEACIVMQIRPSDDPNERKVSWHNVMPNGDICEAHSLRKVQEETGLDINSLTNSEATEETLTQDDLVTVPIDRLGGLESVTRSWAGKKHFDHEVKAVSRHFNADNQHKNNPSPSVPRGAGGS